MWNPSVEKEITELTGHKGNLTIFKLTHWVWYKSVIFGSHEEKRCSVLGLTQGRI